MAISKVNVVSTSSVSAVAAVPGASVKQYTMTRNFSAGIYTITVSDSSNAIVDFGKKYFVENNKYIAKALSEEINSLGRKATPREKVRYAFELFMDNIYLLDTANHNIVIKEVKQIRIGLP